MVLAHATWKEVDLVDRGLVVVLPTGSLEQHGPHLPLFTDSILVTAVAEAAEKQIPAQCILAPTIWLGASAHHLEFPGSLSATSESYMATLKAAIRSLEHHGFQKFLVLNGHGGNTSLNDVALRDLKAESPNHVYAHFGYFECCDFEAGAVMRGRSRRIQHACEAETSLMLHVRPDLVRFDRAIDDGLGADPEIRGLVATFDEITEQGVLGEATLATSEKGRIMFEAAVAGVIEQIVRLDAGHRWVGSA